MTAGKPPAPVTAGKPLPPVTEGSPEEVALAITFAVEAPVTDNAPILSASLLAAGGFLYGIA